MKYTIEQLQAEYMEACDSVRIAEKAQSEANANYQFEIDKHKGDGYSRFSAWIEENREELDELQAATDTARAFVHETRLYKECILEMLQNAARETLEATLYGENFKGDNMPMHFKKWRAYALENFSEDIGASVDGRYIRLFWSRKDPVTGEYLPGSTDLGEYMAYGIKGDINAPIFCSEEYTSRTNQLRYDYTLSTIDYKGSSIGHTRVITEVNLLFLLGFSFLVFELYSYIERFFEGSKIIFCFLFALLWLFKFIFFKTERELLASIIVDWIKLVKNLLQTVFYEVFPRFFLVNHHIWDFDRVIFLSEE